MRAHTATAVAAVVLAAGCAGEDSGSPTAAEARAGDIDAAVARWAQSTTYTEAAAAAEEAANLVVGPGGPGYGDRDGDGEVRGETERGLLPGAEGSPEGIALEDTADCDARDVLGGSWRDPQARWEELARAVEGWEPDHNTFPDLVSHPMRVVGWATLTLRSDDLDLAHEYAGHAGLHSGVTQSVLAAC